MKKTLILLVLILSTLKMSAQLSTDDKYGYVNHLSVGAGIGFVSNIATYKLLTNVSYIKPWKAKVLSYIVGAGAGFLAGDIKEKYDMRHGGHYNNNDLMYTGAGAICGSTIAGCILIIDMPERYARKYKSDLIID